MWKSSVLSDLWQKVTESLASFCSNEYRKYRAVYYAFLVWRILVGEIYESRLIYSSSILGEKEVARTSRLRFTDKVILSYYAVTTTIRSCIQHCRQRGRENEVVIFTTILIVWPAFNPHPGHVIASLHKTLNDDYLCFGGARTSSKFSEQELEEISKNTES